MDGVFNARCVNTTPGANDGPFAPPLGFAGGPGEYMDLIRERFHGDIAYQVRFASYARAFRNGFPMEISGPYELVARAALKRIVKRLFPSADAAEVEQSDLPLLRRSS